MLDYRREPLGKQRRNLSNIFDGMLFCWFINILKVHKYFYKNFKVLDLDDITELLSVWQDEQGSTITLKVLQLPKDSTYLDAFLKYVRERLKQTNIV